MSRDDGLVRTRDGDLVLPDPPVIPNRPQERLEDASHDCRDGWLGPEVNPAPCPTCRPATVARLAERRSRCRVCRLRMDPVLVELGHRSHPLCDPDDRGAA